MKIDPLQQYAKLRQQLMAEKSQLENRLKQINEVLGSESETRRPQAPQLEQAQEAPARRGRPPGRRGRKPSAGNTMSLREAVVKALSNGPIARKDLVKAVEGVGYKFTTNKPLNSIGSILYNKKSGVKNKLGKFYVDGGPAAVNPSTSNAEVQAPAKKKKRKMSAAGRARIAAAAKAMWARRKAGK